MLRPILTTRARSSAWSERRSYRTGSETTVGPGFKSPRAHTVIDLEEIDEKLRSNDPGKHREALEELLKSVRKGFHHTVVNALTTILLHYPHTHKTLGEVFSHKHLHTLYSLRKGEDYYKALSAFTSLFLLSNVPRDRKPYISVVLKNLSKDNTARHVIDVLGHLVSHREDVFGTTHIRDLISSLTPEDLLRLMNLYHTETESFDTFFILSMIARHSEGARKLVQLVEGHPGRVHIALDHLPLLLPHARSDRLLLTIGSKLLARRVERGREGELPLVLESGVKETRLQPSRTIREVVRLLKEAGIPVRSLEDMVEVLDDIIFLGESDLYLTKEKKKVLENNGRGEMVELAEKVQNHQEELLKDLRNIRVRRIKLSKYPKRWEEWKDIPLLYSHGYWAFASHVLPYVSPYLDRYKIIGEVHTYDLEGNPLIREEELGTVVLGKLPDGRHVLMGFDPNFFHYSSTNAVADVMDHIEDILSKMGADTILVSSDVRRAFDLLPFEREPLRNHYTFVGETTMPPGRLIGKEQRNDRVIGFEVYRKGVNNIRFPILT